MQRILKLLVDRALSPESGRISHDDIVGWVGSLENSEFYNSVSLALARHYHAGHLSYSICDRIMNDLWTAVTTGLLSSGHTDVPEPFYDIYSAFDAGEYHRKADLSDDPIEEFTNPMIAELLLEYPAPEDAVSHSRRTDSGAIKQTET